MLKRHLKAFHYDPNNRIEWELMRDMAKGKDRPDFAAYGGSDVGKITGYDPYTSPLVFYYRECGWMRGERETNMDMYRGQVSEDHIYNNYYKFFDPENPSTETFLENARKGRVIRKASRKNALVINPKFPHLFYNIDFLKHKHGTTPHGILELKNMKGLEMDKWDIGVPPNYIQQAYCYMGGLELKHAEIFVLKDSTYPHSFNYFYDKDNFYWIVDTVNDFVARVVTVKTLIHNNAPEDEVMQALSENEPPIGNAENYLKAMKEKHKPENQHEIEGTEQFLRDAVRYLEASEQLSYLEEEKDMAKALMVKFMEDNKANIVTLKGYPSVKWLEKFSVPSKILKKYRELEDL